MIERELTNLMYELLSPVENPDCGRLYLELFDKHVLRLNMSAEELDSAKVYGEYPTQLIERTRYIDLAIITSRRFIPIEVKIDAGEQPNQCYDYWHEAEKYHETYSLSEPPVLYFLTPEGYFPESANGLNFKEIDTISFRSEIFHWLEACRKQTPENSSCSQKLLLLSLKTCLIIGKTTPLEKIMCNFFAALDEQFDESFCRKYHLKRGSNRRYEVGDYDNWQRSVEAFYGNGYSAPGIGLLCTDAAGNVIKFDDDKELWFRVECHNCKGCEVSYIWGELYAYFIIFDHSIKNYLYKKKDVTKFLGGKSILPQKFVDNYDEKFDGPIGRIALHDAQKRIIDFRDIDNFWLGLMNPARRTIAVEHIMMEIEVLLERFVNG